MKLKINEAMALHTAKTGEVLKSNELAALLFPEAPTPAAKQVAMSNLKRGRTTRVKPEWIVTICHYCHCSAEFLLGMEEV